jgi:hypothetical protein
MYIGKRLNLTDEELVDVLFGWLIRIHRFMQPGLLFILHQFERVRLWSMSMSLYLRTPPTRSVRVHAISGRFDGTDVAQVDVVHSAQFDSFVRDAFDLDGDFREITILIHEQEPDSPRDSSIYAPILTEGHRNALLGMPNFVDVHSSMTEVYTDAFENVLGFRDNTISDDGYSVHISETDDDSENFTQIITVIGVNMSDEDVGASGHARVSTSDGSVYVSEEDVEEVALKNKGTDMSSDISVNISDEDMGCSNFNFNASD